MLATWPAMDKLPNLTEPLYQGVYQKLDTDRPSLSQAVTVIGGENSEETLANIEESHPLALAVANGHSIMKWRERRGSNPRLFAIMLSKLTPFRSCSHRRSQ